MNTSYICVASAYRICLTIRTKEQKVLRALGRPGHHFRRGAKAIHAHTRSSKSHLVMAKLGNANSKRLVSALASTAYTVLVYSVVLALLTYDCFLAVHVRLLLAEAKRSAAALDEVRRMVHSLCATLLLRTARARVENGHANLFGMRAGSTPTRPLLPFRIGPSPIRDPGGV